MDRLRLLKITIFLAILSAFVQADEELKNSRKVDESPPDLDDKCGGCPCDNPCNKPTPSPPPPSPPPPPANPPPSNYCPPPPGNYFPSPPSPKKPPSPPYMYVNGPPGNLYPVYPYYSGVGRSFSMGIVPLLISSLLWLLTF
ncbi:hypothetical protein CDL12_01268 [Handroanthus impetiginosus]|uniref:Uncharacterized protein n=1 Tax=Handroanthus impetiginosus TaxID=429701 RepID=A0A2G9I8A7_9LAMI|nr:hypothetical protein CDL12_01268 [Handroanthus impetiginosus]